MKSHKKKALIVAAALLLISVCGFAWKKHGTDRLLVSGTLEARNITVGSKIGGRVSRVLVHEGDRVEPNQLLVEFDSAELEGQLLQAQGRVQSAQADLNKMLRGSRSEDIAEASAAVQPTNGIPGFRQAELAQAQADLARARTDLTSAEREFRRTEQLTNAGVESGQALDNARDRYQAAKAQADSSQFAVSAAEGRLNAARAAADRTQHGFRAEDVAAARAELIRAQGELKTTEARWAEREVRAPSRAIIESLDLRPGDLLPANAPIAKLLEADQLYLMVYVPETEIGKVSIGKFAEVRVDSYAGKTFKGYVEQIRQQAEFLPRNVQTKEEHVHQVIGVKLRVENPDNRLRAGISADVTFAPETSQ